VFIAVVVQGGHDGDGGVADGVHVAVVWVLKGVGGKGGDVRARLVGACCSKRRVCSSCGGRRERGEEEMAGAGKCW
jgi:hypothetical protein